LIYKDIKIEYKSLTAHEAPLSGLFLFYPTNTTLHYLKEVLNFDVQWQHPGVHTFRPPSPHLREISTGYITIVTDTPLRRNTIQAF